MGQLYRRKKKLKDGTIVELPTWWMKYYRDGKPMRESAGTTSQKEAATQLKRREGDISRGLPVAPKMNRQTFDEAATAIVNEYDENGRKSIDEVRRRIDLHLRPFFGGSTRMAHITTKVVRDYVAHRRACRIVTGKGDDRKERPVSNAEINRELTTLKRMFSLGIEHEVLTQRPKITLLNEDNVRKGFLDADQIAAVIGHLPNDLKPAIEFAYITGWRVPSEVLPLEWSQVDFAAGQIRLEPGTTKNRRGRSFPMTGALRRLLKDQHARTLALQKKENKIVPWVFHRGGERIVSLLKAFKAACRKAGCPGRIPHDLRRSAVRNLVRAGVPDSVAMSMTGHKTRSVFDRYDITSPGDQADAARKLDSYSTTIDSANKLTGTLSGTPAANPAS